MKRTPEFLSEAGRWRAVVQRDPQADGAFVYAVATTGIYCRPTCSSRRPNRENARFFDTWQQAEEAGFRPCKRCTPQTSVAPNTAVDAVAQACQIIEQAEQEPSLKQLADAVGLSPYHFHRLFKKTVGITPKQYAMQKRLNRVRHTLRQNSTVTNAVYEAGFESGSRFYETAATSLGMKPSEYQKGGTGVSIRYAVVQSYLGWVLIAASERGICRIDFGDDPEILQTRLKATFPGAKLQDGDPAFATIVAQTLAFLETPEQGLALPLDVQGTAFQRRVWSVLQTIQPGSTASYAE
ncbi:MAG: helix-turn-helix domain-containing protein, partial [Chloroflexi bacterium]